jgi:hypothetical protein
MPAESNIVQTLGYAVVHSWLIAWISNFPAEQILLVAARKVISGGGDLDRKGEKRRDSKETFRNRVSRKRLCLTRLAYQVS